MDTAYFWRQASSNCRYQYLHDNLTNFCAAKLYFMHGRWNISIKDKANEAHVRKLCEAKIVELVCKKLEE